MCQPVAPLHAGLLQLPPLSNLQDYATKILVETADVFPPEWSLIGTNQYPIIPFAGRDVQPALIGRHYVTEHDIVPVQYNGIV